MAGSSLGRHKMNRRTSPIRSLPIETSENESTAKVFSKAFHAAKKEDGDNFMRSITIKPGDDIVSGAPHYMVGRPWMLSFLSFLKTEDESSRPGKITNATLLIPSCSAVNTDDNTEGMSSSEQSTDSNGGYVVVSSLSKDLTVKNSNTVGGSDEGSNSWVEITRQNVDEKTVEHLVMRPEMKIDNDFVLVGKGLWTLLSSKFGFDFAITHLPRIFSETEGQASFQNSPMVVVYPDLLSDSLATCAIVPIPEGGIFDYNDPSDTDLVSEDETPQDDLFPMDDDFEDSTTNSSPPILLLPPSTTGQDTSHDENMGSNNLMMTDKDEASNNPKKRKRFGAGLGNLGNTCFMNSTLQCLAHTGPIRQYFLSGEYLNDLNKDNPLGTGGELASEFATLLSQMWGTGKSNDSGSNCGTRNSYSSYSSNSYGSSGSVVYPRSFKTTLGKHAEQFVGYSQHDSQELATYLLDALHEDTNRVLKKPYVENPEQGEDEVDEQAAEKAWGLHLKREDSRVLESFMGQVKSRVECPRESCGRVSTTFDPFMYLSVPLPGASERIMDITYVPYGSHERRKRLKVAVTKTGTIADLRHKIVDAINTESAGNYVVNASNIVLTDIWNKEVFSYYNNEDEIDKIRDNDTTSAFEVTSIASIRAHRIEIERQEKDNEANINCREISCDEDILDLATITKLNTDHVWRATLEKYAVQTLSLTTLLNRRRGTHVDRMEFQKKANDFLLQCYSSVEFRAHSSGDEVESTEDRLISEENNRDTDIDLELNQEVENDTTVTQAPISASSSASLNENNQLSLAALCDNSETFQDVKTMTDVATFEICCDKFYEFSSLEQKQKYDKFCDGIDIQVIVKKPTRHYTAMQEKLLGSALMIRIPPRATVFELRTILSERLSSLLLTKLSTVVDENPNEAIAMDNEKESQDVELAPSSLHGSDEDKKSEKVEVDFIGSEEDKKSEKIEVEFVESPSLDEANILRRCPLSYERKTPYQGSYSKNCAYRQLGSIPKADGDKPSHIARPDNDAEQETILDIVGYRGKVNIHVPQDFVDLFNEEEWDSTDDISSGNNEESSETIAKSPSVLDCISKYCQTEQLEESEMWYCNKCKDHVRAWKQFHLYRAPPILIVHLKRFQYSASTHRRDKIDTFIDFPLSGLDLQKEVLHWSNGEEPIYDCYAVSNHYGGLGGGHYTAYAQNDDGEWCYFDDSRVTTLVKENEVISAAAYVLYYRRRDVKVENEAWRNRALPRVSLDMDEQNLSKKMDVEESGAACDSEEGRMSTGTSDEDMEQSTLNVSCEKVV